MVVVVVVVLVDVVLLFVVCCYCAVEGGVRVGRSAKKPHCSQLAAVWLLAFGFLAFRFRL